MLEFMNHITKKFKFELHKKSMILKLYKNINILKFHDKKLDEITWKIFLIVILFETKNILRNMI